MLTLSSAAKAEKNKLYGDSTWPILLEISISDAVTLYLCSGGADVVWGGQTWTCFPFELGDVKDTGKGEIPNVSVMVSNITQEIQRYVEQGNGAIGQSVIIRVVNSKHLDLATPEIRLDYVVEKVHYDAKVITFTLSGNHSLTRRVPPFRYLKDFCPFQYCDLRCGVPEAAKATYPTCDKTLTQCRERDNSFRFGGEIAIPIGGFYASK